MHAEREKIQDKDTQERGSSNHFHGKTRRRRTVYSQAHLDLLLSTFDTDPYPGIAVRERLSQLTGVHESRIQVWFQNRRARKKSVHERENVQNTNEWQQYNHISKTNKSSQAEWISKNNGHYKNQEFGFGNRSVNSYPYTNSSKSSALRFPLPFQWPKPMQASFNHLASVYPPRISDSRTQQHQVFIRQISTSHLTPAISILHSKDCVSQPESVSYGTMQEWSLEQMLEEFQPCWTNVADNFIDNINKVCHSVH
ncbi:pituitary homeobox 3 [Xenopus laevis]|uniref:Pituitary homeobox 3 n=2 Tax=Xenopus laevis TaxID=8355 RepID=A0A1L8FK81_XENLA|nr:pituitary homeobox 3 [Xenopus laevis]OCT71984.1 hypothetical protein XELAEV_18034963mg [Xenopus laevis]